MGEIVKQMLKEDTLALTLPLLQMKSGCGIISDVFFQNAKRASTAAAPLAAWVKANVQYSHVLERIQPLETEQAGLES